MKRLFLAALLGATFLANFAFAQNTDSPKYAEMTNGEKRQFIETEANKILALFRRVKGDELNAANIDQIKLLIESYYRRNPDKKPNPAKCSFGDSLKTVLQRGRTNAPAIKTSFAAKNIPSQVGLYIAMTETEFCPCLQAPTGALGMFQFTKSVANTYGLKTVENASPQNPDDRCKPDLASRAAAAYFDNLLNQFFGRNAIGFPLSVLAYNAGEGNTKVLLREVKTETDKEDISFWLLRELIEKKWKNSTQIDIESEDKSGDDEKKNETPRSVKQFLNEGEKYVHKFFAAAIVGENPKTFGIDMTPLSQAKGK